MATPTVQTRGSARHKTPVTHSAENGHPKLVARNLPASVLQPPAVLKLSDLEWERGLVHLAHGVPDALTIRFLKNSACIVDTASSSALREFMRDMVSPKQMMVMLHAGQKRLAELQSRGFYLPKKRNSKKA